MSFAVTKTNVWLNFPQILISMCSMSRYIQNIFKQIQLYLIFQGNHYPLSCQTIYEWYFSPNVIAVTGYIPGFLDEVRVAHLFSFLCCALSWLFSFWVLCPNAAYVSGLFVFLDILHILIKICGKFSHTFLIIFARKYELFDGEILFWKIQIYYIVFSFSLLMCIILCYSWWYCLYLCLGELLVASGCM
jgi:hypothetical protein